MKYFAVLVLAILAACIATSFAQSHNYVWGYIGPTDKLLQQSVISKRGKLLQVIKEEINYPPAGIVGNIITGIKITDQYSNGKGGYAKLVSGGPGFSYAKLELTSQRGNGLKFTSEIYGRVN